jgi:RimJ/RimL family protein N-acetyltransferase
VTLHNEHGQPIGEPVPGWAPRPAPARVTLTGRYARLEPVSVDHVPALHAALCTDPDDSLWTYRHDERPADVAGLTTMVEGWVAREPDVTFTIVPLDIGSPAGVATLCRLDPTQGSAEVGAVLYARSLQRTRAATEAIHLLASYLFDELGYRRFEWKLDALNAPSARAATRLGFSYEGRFRNALVYKGRNRDTDWFAMTDADWPAVRAAHRRWLDPGNFDEQGRQRTALGADHADG